MLNDSMRLKWINAGGGPLVLLSNELLLFWEGSTVPSDGRVLEANFRWDGIGTTATDYDRACDIHDYVGLIGVGSSQGLVLGDAPLLTSWYPGKDTKRAGTFIRWVYANDEESLLHAVDQALSAHDIWQSEQFTFSVGQQPLFLFDAALSGRELDPGDCLTIELNPGTYSIATARYEPDKRTAAVLHHLAINA